VVKAYYDRRAREYDDWYRGTGLFAARDRPNWAEELAELELAIGALAPGRVLDVACGTGFLTRRLRGDVVALDQSESMLELARERRPDATFVQGDALALPFPNCCFDRLFTAHFYGHLEEPERSAFLAEARRVATEVVVVDSALRDDVEPEEWQERVLNDGSRHEVYKRYFTAEGLAGELGGGRTLHAGRWFVAVVSPNPPQP
jgi:demethylmenaquinone methyltransferase/2-methoxy-6-polyprenyl-1,4-benzoquinol methylase